jgi:Fe-S oxidoreductase
MDTTVTDFSAFIFQVNRKRTRSLVKFRREAKSNQKDEVLYGYFKHCFTDRCPKEIGKKVLSSEQRRFWEL